MFLVTYMLALADYHFVFDSLPYILSNLPVCKADSAAELQCTHEVCNALANSEQTL